MSKPVKLSKWIEEFGAQKLADTLRVTKVAVYQWARGTTSPRYGTAIKICSLSKNKLSINDVLEAGLSRETPPAKKPAVKAASVIKKGKVKNTRAKAAPKAKAKKGSENLDAVFGASPKAKKKK